MIHPAGITALYITHWPSMEDSLGSYLEQLGRVRDIPVSLALPGHRKTGDYRARIDQILAHHDRRNQKLLCGTMRDYAA